MKLGKKEIDLSGVTPQTVGRTIALVIALINQFLVMFGKGQIEIMENDIYQMCSYIYLFISAVWGFWKNESYSETAQDADEIMKAKENGDSVALSIAVQKVIGELEYEPKPEPNTTDHHATGGVG